MTTTLNSDEISFSHPQKFIRNFSIIAHIDHGKSTVSDRIIQRCGGLQAREMSEQVLDSMELERERGITIKSQSVSLKFEKDGDIYQLNLIDTPGHVDFSYEVSRSLAACEGALLLVDASQGVQAQTVATCYTALELGLEVLPALNKIDLPTAYPEEVAAQVRSIIGLDTNDSIHCSGKSGVGIDELLSQVIEKIPAPQGDRTAPLQALIIDSWFDNYLGVISLVRIKEGCLKIGDRVKIIGIEKEHFLDCMGVFTPKRQAVKALSAGEVGWISYAMKDILGAPVGATLTHMHGAAQAPLPGFKRISPQVYAGLFPVETEEFENFRRALEKLSLNDASLTFEPESSSALGLGFRCGFLGLLHMEIIQERLEREYNLDLIATAPTVVYKVKTKNEELLIETPSKLPATTSIEEILEPLVECHILTPKEYLGKILQICAERRGKQLDLNYHHHQVSVSYELPMNEVIIDFFDQLKSSSRGYASLEYNFKKFVPADIVKLDILINGERIDALASLVHRSHVASRGRKIVEYLSQVISRQQFDLAIQAAIGNQILARSTIKQYRKNVTGKCYGGDITRKRKLLEKQKAGKKKMKMLGKVEVPKSAFLSLLNLKTHASTE